MRNYLIIFTAISIFVSTPCFSTAFIGEGTGNNAREAQADAYSDLKALLSDSALQLHYSRNSMSTSNYRRTSSLPVIAETTESSHGKRIARSTVFIDSASSLTEYKKRINRVRKSIFVLLNEKNKNTNRNITYRILSKLLVKIDEHEGLTMIARLLGDRSIQPLPVSEANIKKDIFRLLITQNKINDAAMKAIAYLNVNGNKPVFVYPPLSNGSPEVTPFSDSIQKTLRKYAGQRSKPNNPNGYITGEYELRGNSIFLLLYRYSSKNTPLASTAILLNKNLYSRSDILPSYSKFTNQLSRGLVRVKATNNNIARKKYSSENTAKIYRSFRVSMRTDKGKSGISYQIGDSDNLYFKVNDSGFIYIIGHILKKNKKLSYLLPLSNRRGNNKFIRKILPTEINTWKQLGRFDIDAPSGLEAIQIFASTENPQNTIPKSYFDKRTGLYLIGDNPEATVKRLRGLVKIRQNNSTKNNGGKSRQIRYAEDTLQYTTLSKRY